MWFPFVKRVRYTPEEKESLEEYVRWGMAPKTADEARKAVERTLLALDNLWSFRDVNTSRDKAMAKKRKTLFKLRSKAAHCSLMRVPTFINDEHPSVRLIARWRLSHGK